MLEELFPGSDGYQHSLRTAMRAKEHRLRIALVEPLGDLSEGCAHLAGRNHVFRHSLRVPKFVQVSVTTSRSGILPAVATAVARRPPSSRRSPWSVCTLRRPRFAVRWSSLSPLMVRGPRSIRLVRRDNREPGANPGLPRSGDRERPPSPVRTDGSSTGRSVGRACEAANEPGKRWPVGTTGTAPTGGRCRPESPKTCHW